jgi:RecB family exonuclease
MLKVELIGSPGDKLARLESFDPAKQTWLVSDLKSKLELQRRMLERADHLQEVAIMRASELWRHLAWRLRPDVRVVSLDLIRTLLQRELETQSVSWAKGPLAARTLTQLMPQFLPLIRQLPDVDLAREWLAEHPRSLMRWGHWFELSLRIWRRLEEQKVVPPQWLPGLLVGEPDLPKAWSRHLIVDLSAQVTAIEIEIIRRLSRDSDVTVLVPAPPWRQAFADSMTVYEKLERLPEAPVLKGRADLRLKGSPDLRRFASPLAEVKDAVAQVRAWLEKGVADQRIAIVAPDIEVYWPLLAPTLAEEGIGVMKSRTVRSHGLAWVQSWLARLRLEMGGSDRGDLEMATFSIDGAPINYDRFRRLFTNIYDREQLQSDDFLSRQFQLTLDPNDVVTCTEFVTRAAAKWRGSDFDSFKRMIKQLLEDAPTSTRLPMRLWMDWLQSSLGNPKMELTVEVAKPGIHCINLLAGEWLPATHFYFLGLNEESLRELQVHGLSAVEVAQLDRDLGVVLPAAERGHLEFEARWLLDANSQAVVMSCAATDPGGTPMTPSRLWLMQSERPREHLAEVQAPEITRWDEIQRAPLSAIAEVRWWNKERVSRTLVSLRQDLGLEELPPFAPDLELSLSASALEKYARCPFIFTAEKLLHLKDQIAIDLDLDASSRGSLIHAIFEHLTQEPRKWDWTEGELIDLIEAARERINYPDLGLWDSMRPRFVELALRFLAAEKEWRNQFPSTKTIGRELRLKGRWLPGENRLVRDTEQADKGYPVTGQIDRVDGDRGEYVILDYKSSSREVAGIESWARNDNYQLALYAQALEQGLTDLPPGLVRGAFYYVARDFERTRGMHVTGENSLLPEKGRRNTGVDLEKRDKIFAQINDKIGDLVRRIRSGDFGPKPKTFDLCDNCSWRNQCRAPHLQ